MLFEISLILWYLLQVKQILFWLYLWQLKDYHLGRFLAHFSTTSGRELIFGRFIKLKTLFVLIPTLLLIFGKAFPGFALNVLTLNAQAIIWFYVIFGFIGLVYLLFGKAKTPKFNLKISFLFIVSFIGFAILQNIVLQIIGMFFFLQMGEVVALPLIDLLIPFVVAISVLFWQPVTYVWQRVIMLLASKKRLERKDLVVIGITGSYGKSTTKEIVAYLLSKKFKVCKTKKNQNSEIGISRAILNDLLPEHQIFVCEMGAYNVGGIKMLCDIAKPKFGIITGINEQHQATFGPWPNTIRAKFELAHYLPSDGAVFLNTHNSFIAQKQNDNFAVKQRFLAGPQGDIWAENIKVTNFATEFDLNGKNISKQSVKIDLPGGFSLIENTLLAILVAQRMGMNLDEIIQAIKTLPRDLGSFFIGKSATGFNLIKSTYSSNPNGVLANLQYFSSFPGKRIVIMPCLIELGQSAPRVHEEIGKMIGQTCDLAIITNADYFNEIKKGACLSNMQENRVVMISDSEEIIKEIKFFAQNQDSILVQGRVSPVLIKLLDNL